MLLENTAIKNVIVLKKARKSRRIIGEILANAVWDTNASRVTGQSHS